MIEETMLYTELQREMREALRTQHPEWVNPDGNSPICDLYEARFAELLRLAAPGKQGENGATFYPIGSSLADLER